MPCPNAFGGSVVGRSPNPPPRRCRYPPARCSYILVSAATIAGLADRFGLTVDQVTNEFESWALCARALLPAPRARIRLSVATPAAAARRRAAFGHSACRGRRGYRRLLHGGVMMALGTACAWTNRAAVWGFCTRLDRTAQATADWKPFTVGNLSMALSWYRRQEIRRRRPDYDTLEQDDPRKAAVAEEAGQELLVDLANPTLIAEMQAKHKDLDMTTLTLKRARALDQSRVRREGMKSMGQELRDVKTMQIWTRQGERPTPKGARHRLPGPPGGPGSDRPG